MQSPLPVLIADDHTLMRHGMRKILHEQGDFTVVDEACDGREAVAKVIEHQPTVAILDIGMPRLNGIEATRQICRRAPQVQVLIVSMHNDDAYLVQAMQSGARGYLLKDSADSDLVRAVQATAAGRSFFSPAVASVMLNGYVRELTARGVTNRYELLSSREREVLQLVAEGRSSKAVAELLGLSPTTVDTHRMHILQKLELRNMAELVLFAARQGLVS